MTGEYQPLTNLGDLAETVKAKANVLLLQPADVLVLSNADGITAAPGSAELIERIRDDLGVSQVYVFAQDIDLSVLRSSTADLDRVYLMGDEDCGVGLHCRDCDRRGKPVAYYNDAMSPNYKYDSVTTTEGIPGLLAAAAEHRRTVHAEAAT